MAKRLKPGDNAAGPKKYPSAEVVERVFATIAAARQRLDDQSTAHASAWKGIESLQLEKAVVQLVLKLEKMDPSKRDVFLADFDWLRGTRNLDAQGNLFEAEGSDDAGDGETTEGAENPAADAMRSAEGRKAANAYHAGEKAGREGRGQDRNPYLNGEQALRTKWDEGWFDAQESRVAEMTPREPARRGGNGAARGAQPAA